MTIEFSSEDDSTLEKLRQIARPVIFRTGISEMPFSAKGTAFLLGYRSTLFVLSARHVVHGMPWSKISVVAADGQSNLLDFNNGWTVADGELGSDASDLFIAVANHRDVQRKTRRRARLFELRPDDVSDWHEARFSSRLVLFGYPSIDTELHSDDGSLRFSQVLLAGRYVGPSFAAQLHEGEFGNPLQVPNFDGLSGSPVFSIFQRVGARSTISLAGMVLRGGAQSGRIHFIETEALHLALEKAIHRLRFG
jgi:hypothetical protein